MQDHPKGARDERAIANWEEDDRHQAAILREVLELHPAALTMDELVRLMTSGGTREFPEFDAIQRAVRELGGSGLLHRPGEDEMIRPTRAALRSSELAGGAD